MNTEQMIELRGKARVAAHYKVNAVLDFIYSLFEQWMADEWYNSLDQDLKDAMLDAFVDELMPHA